MNVVNRSLAPPEDPRDVEQGSLRAGLRAIEALVRHGPLDLARLARLNGWSIDRATALVAVLQADGWARRIDGSQQFVASAQAVAIVRPATGLVA